MSRTVPTPGHDGPSRSSSRTAEGSRIESAVGLGAVDDSALARAGLARIDYVDQFLLAPVDGLRATAEEWARALFGDTPSLSERFIWEVLLQLRLHRGRSPSTVAGWQVAQRGEDWIRLESASWALRAELVIRRTDASVSLTTFMQYDRSIGRVVWTLLSAIHRRLAPGLLRDGAAVVASR